LERLVSAQSSPKNGRSAACWADTFAMSQKSEERTMNTIDGLSVKTERGANVKRTRPENGFCNVIDGEEVSGRKKLPVVNPATE
jgi:hypothetical protein